MFSTYSESDNSQKFGQSHDVFTITQCEPSVNSGDDENLLQQTDDEHSKDPLPSHLSDSEGLEHYQLHQLN